MPTTDELVQRLVNTLEREKQGPLNAFAFELAKDIMDFLRREYHRSFPEVHFHFLNGEYYRERLRKVGVTASMIEGSSGFYIGNRYGADVYVDLGDTREYLVEGNVKGAVLRIVHVLMEELTHVVFPDILDRDIWREVVRLVEGYLTDFRFTDQQKAMIRDAVSGAPRDGPFSPKNESEPDYP
jgi:hypothetical protein